MMKIKVCVKVPLAAAVAMASASYGEAEVELSEADLSTLSEAAKALLVSARQSDRRSALLVAGDNLCVPVPTSPAACAAIEDRVESARAETAKRHAEEEAKVLDAICKPSEEWIAKGEAESNRAPYVLEDPRGIYLPPASRADPRVKERRQHLETNVLPPLLAKYAAERAEYVARLDAESRAKDTARKAWQDSARAYVIANVPEFARAARDGHDVDAVAMGFSRDALSELLDSVGLTTVDVYNDTKPKGRPPQHAYDVFDAVQMAVANAIADKLPAAGPGIVEKIECSIVRADTCEEKGCCDGFRTCVEVAIAYGNGFKRYVWAYADSKPEHVHPDDGEDCDGE